MRVCPHCWSTYTSDKAFCGIDGKELVEQAEDPLIGKTLDRYKISARLGTGAMGAVYRARHTVLGHDYALKVLFGDFASDGRLVARFKREAQAAGQIKHDHIVSVVDFGKAETGLTFLVMELVEGETLSEVLEREGAMEPARAGRIAKHIALALAEAHRLGFVHRDLKPANVMLSGRGPEEVAKILDFGVVGAIGTDDNTKLTRTGTIVGTPLYMAPEQAQGDPATPASDIYALGVILYEMLAGRPPFTGSSLRKVVMKHLTEPPPPLPPSNGLERLVPALLQKAPARRPNRAHQVVHELEGILQQGGSYSSEMLDAVITDGLSQLPTAPPPPAAQTQVHEPDLERTQDPRSLNIVLDTDPPPPPYEAGEKLPTPEPVDESDPPSPAARRARTPAPARWETPVPRWAPSAPPDTSPLVESHFHGRTNPSLTPGMPDSHIEAMVRRRERKQGQTVALMIILIGGSTAVGAYFMTKSSAREVGEVAAQVSESNPSPSRATPNKARKRRKGARTIEAANEQRRPTGPKIRELEARLDRAMTLRGLTTDDLEIYPPTAELVQQLKGSDAETALQQLIGILRDPEIERKLVKRKLAVLSQRIETATGLSHGQTELFRKKLRELESELGRANSAAKRRALSMEVARLERQISKAKSGSGKLELLSNERVE